MLVTSSVHSLLTYHLSLNRPLSRLFLGTCSNQVFFCQPFPQVCTGVCHWLRGRWGCTDVIPARAHRSHFLLVGWALAVCTRRTQYPTAGHALACGAPVCATPTWQWRPVGARGCLSPTPTPNSSAAHPPTALIPRSPGAVCGAPSLFLHEPGGSHGGVPEQCCLAVPRRAEVA